MELERLAAIEKLAAEYGETWQDKVPADLVWMLTSGVRMPEALARAADLVSGEERNRALEAELAAERDARARAEAERDRAAAKAEAATRKTSGTTARTRGRNRTGTGTPEPETSKAGTSSAAEEPDLDTEAKILKLISEGHSASKAGVLAGKSDSYGRQVARLAKTAPTDIVDGK
jgi:hypothetical protein